jgi:hypothetical protein
MLLPADDSQLASTPNGFAQQESDWLHDLILVRDLRTPHMLAAFVREVRRGSYVNLARGVYVDAERWAKADRHERYVARIVAISALASPEELVFSHESAAAIWRLPKIGSWPETVHVTEASSPGGRSTTSIMRHTVGLPDRCAVIAGIRVTTLARTVVDLAARYDFGPAVAVADAALRRGSLADRRLPPGVVVREDLEAELARIPLRQGRRKATRVVEFADGAADRPGESMSRASIHLSGLEMPLLQQPLSGASGKNYVVDFWWPRLRLIGEFDGKYKYTDEEFLQGRTASQAVYDEKLREDDLRAAGYGMSRWNWELAISPQRLGTHLQRAGIARVRPSAPPLRSRR